jgi:hypothetical protein
MRQKKNIKYLIKLMVDFFHFFTHYQHRKGQELGVFRSQLKYILSYVDYFWIDASRTRQYVDEWWNYYIQWLI